MDITFYEQGHFKFTSLLVRFKIIINQLDFRIAAVYFILVKNDIPAVIEIFTAQVLINKLLPYENRITKN